MSTETTPTVPSSRSSATPLDLEALPTCAWCDDIALGWATVESGFAVWHPSCGEHGSDFRKQEGLLTAIRAEVKRLRSLLGEKEWEYGVEYNNSGHVNPHSEKFAREVTQDRNDLTLVQRIKAIPAGPWQPVPPSTTPPPRRTER